MARAITTEELTLLRSDNQRSKLRIYVDKPSTVFAARVAAVPEKNDEVTQVTIGTKTGTAANVADGMTVLVGTSAGGYDVGIIRARAASGILLQVGSTSDIEWAVGQYITVLDDFQIWARPLRYSDGLWNIEGEEAYADQNSNCKPVPVLGPTVAVLPYNGSPVTFTPTALSSWIPTNSINGYTWAAPGASATANMTTDAPTITYNAPGVYRVRCTIVSSTGAAATGYRIVYVPGTGYEPAVNFTIEKISGELQSGGWQFAVTMYDASELAGIRPRALVALYAEDYYGSQQQSLGPVAGYENVIAIGWIDGATIDWAPEIGLVRFTVKGPSDWMQKASSWPISLLDTTETPTDWMHMNYLSVKKALWHLVSWRSTVSKVIDVFGNTDSHNRAFDCSGNLGNLWEQLKAFGVKDGSEPVCDRYGRLFLQPDPQLLRMYMRSAIPVVMDITKNDWQGAINIQKRDYRQVSLVEVAGFTYNGTDWGASLARAPGNAMSHTGNMTSRYNFVFQDQSEANELAELVYAKENNQYPVIPIQLAANNRMIDIAPRQYLTLTMTSTDNPLGLEWNAEKIIPRRVEFAWDADSGALTAEIECERATVPISPSVAVVPPSVPTPNLPPLPDWGATDWPVVPGGYGPPDTYLPEDPEPDPASTCPTMLDAPKNGPFDLGLYGSHEDTDEISRGFGCYVRSSYHNNETKYEIRGAFQAFDHLNGVWKDTAADDFYEVRANVAGGGTIVGVKDPVSNPNIRSGVLPGGADSVLISSIDIIWTKLFYLRPEVVVTVAGFTTLVSGGTQVWWPKRRGLAFEWLGIQGISSGGPVKNRIVAKWFMNCPTGHTSYANRQWLAHIEMKNNGSADDGLVYGSGPLAFGNLSDTLNFPKTDEEYFGKFTTNVNMGSFGIWYDAYLNQFNFGYELSMTGEIQPHPDWRINFDGFYLYNICPPPE